MDSKIAKLVDLARIDIKNYGTDENDVKVTVNEGIRYNVWKAWWYSKSGGAGYTIVTYDEHIALRLKCVGDGKLTMAFRGANVQTSKGESVPIWIDYTVLKVNGKQIFKENKSVWHDKPYVLRRDVYDGEMVFVEIFWKPHVYKHEEAAKISSLLNVHKQDLGKKALIEEKSIAEKRSHEKEIESIIPLVHIANKWAALREDDLKDLSQLIKKFDEGFYSVSILDKKDRFLKVVNKYQFTKDFPGKYRTLKNLYVDFDDDEKVLKYKLAELFLDTPRQEIPILSRGKIKALGRYTTYFDEQGCWDSSQVYQFDWKWIDENVAKEFLIKYKNVLISSEGGYLKGFRDAFSTWLNVELYSDSILDECFSGKYDLVIDDSDIFSDLFPAKYYRAWRLYYMLLFETVRRWLDRRGISIHMISSAQKINGVENRLSRMGELIAGTVSVLREGATPYYVLDGNLIDTLIGKDKQQPNYHSGRRCVTEAKSIMGNGIYFFGPCTAAGYATYSPDKTIESYLQKRINVENLDYHVINCGTQAVMGYATSINWLHRLMDTPLKDGDIVIVLHDLEEMYGMDSQFIPINRHRLIHPFLSKENIKEKCFVEPVLAHINPRGYEIAADYIYQLIKEDLKEGGSGDVRKSFFSTISSLSVKENSRIGTWLKKLPMHPILKEKDIGAIVLRADPLTKGHIYLLQEALKRCEFLYVFLIGGENGLLSNELVRKIWIEYGNKNKINNVIICRLGSYMRKSYKFSAKFGFVLDAERNFDPVDDTYTFARYIAPILNIRRRFVGEEPFDTFKHRYNILKHEILLEEGIEWVEIPRYRLTDGREIITSSIREIWKKEGWQACKDYLPEEEIRLLEKGNM